MNRILKFIVVILCFLIIGFCCYKTLDFLFPLMFHPSALSEGVINLEYKPKKEDLKYKVVGGYLWVDKKTGVLVGCTGEVINVKIPSEVKGIVIISIADRAFIGCKELISVEISEGIDSIGEYAFNGCTYLSNIKIPKTIKRIESMAFSYCNNLMDVYYEGTEEEWQQIFIASENDNLLNANIHYNS